jgi:PIN domain nuclease of toxin-antitoxin system
VARYREKDETDLRWNRIRRRLTRELDTQIADVREEILNSLLSGAWEKYAEALQTGTKLELESHYGAWVAKALEEAGVGVDLEAA